MRNSLSYAAACRVFSNLCVVGAAFLTIRLYNLYVAKEIYGTILTGLNIFGYLPLMSGGFRMVLNQQMLADPIAAKATARFGQTLQSYFFLVVVLGGMAIMAAYSQAPKIQATGIPILVLVSAGIAGAINFQAGSQLALLVAFGQQVKSSLIQGAWAIAGVGILWISFLFGAGAWAFPLSTGLGALLTVIAVRVALAWTSNDVPLFLWQREPDFWIRFKAVWRPAIDCLYSQIGNVLIFTMDLVLVGILIGPGAAAVYGIVSRVMAISRQLLQSLSEATWPRLAQEPDQALKAQTMRKLDRLNAWLVGAWYGAMALTLHPFLAWLVKPDWVAGPLLIGVLVTRNFIVSLMSPHSYGLLSAGRFKELSRINQQEVIVSLLSGVVLSLTALGMYGTAIAFLLGTLSATAWQFTRTYFRLAHDAHWVREWLAVWMRGVINAIISLAIAGGVWEALQLHFGPIGWLAIVAGGAGFLLPMGVVLGWWRAAGKIP